MAVGTPRRACAPVAAASPLPSVAPRRFSPEYWAGLRFMAFGRAVPGVLFGLMGAIQLSKAITNLQHLEVSHDVVDLGGRVLTPLLYTAFCAIPSLLYLTRPRPAARDGRLVARAAAFTGTLMQLLVGTFLGAGPLLFAAPPVMGDLGALIAIVAFSGALWSLAYLRRSLSIIPEARRLATGGPYRIVRHPLYLFEIMAALGALATGPGVISVISFAVFVAMQMIRARLEERLLAGAFPEYAAYARRTRRLIPFVW
jgi:protein-S-isoprenylcysteine O-methyltransferase Ste14